MNHVRHFLVLALVAGLAACADQPPPPAPTQLVKTQVVGLADPDGGRH